MKMKLRSPTAKRGTIIVATNAVVFREKSRLSPVAVISCSNRNLRLASTLRLIPVRATSPEQLQRNFYTSTSATYDVKYVVPGDEHFVALSLIAALVKGYGHSTVLDVGSGTGRGVKYFLQNLPEVTVRG